MPWPSPEATRDKDVPAVEVELADGNAWGLALPGPRLHPITGQEVDRFGRPGVRIELVTRNNDYPLEVWRLWDAVRAASEDDESRFHDAIRRLTIALLRMAHEIEPEEAKALLDPRRVDLGRIAETFIPPAFGNADPTRPDGR